MLCTLISGSCVGWGKVHKGPHRENLASKLTTTAEHRITLDSGQGQAEDGDVMTSFSSVTQTSLRKNAASFRIKKGAGSITST